MLVVSLLTTVFLVSPLTAAQIAMSEEILTNSILNITCIWNKSIKNICNKTIKNLDKYLQFLTEKSHLQQGTIALCNPFGHITVVFSNNKSHWKSKININQMTSEVRYLKISGWQIWGELVILVGMSVNFYSIENWLNISE